MYKIIFLLLTGMFFSCQQGQEKTQQKSDPVLEKIAGKDYANLIEIPTTPEGEIDSNSMAMIVFEDVQFKFDTIFSGDKVNHTFQFKNEGKKDLYILETNSSCGCTVPAYSKAPIAPGEAGDIQVSFDSKGKSGKQNRKISVITNSYPAEKVLSLTGFVKQMKTD